MRDRILYDQCVDALRMRDGKAHANRPSIILYVKHVMAQSQHFGKVLRDFCQVIERVRKVFGTRGIAVAESRIIRCDQMVLAGEAFEERVIHAR